MGELKPTLSGSPDGVDTPLVNSLRPVGKERIEAKVNYPNYSLVYIYILQPYTFVMQKYAKQIWISAPPEDVLDAVDTPDTWNIIVPSMRDAEVTERDGRGYRLEFGYSLAGVRVKRTLETKATESNSQRAFEFSGAMSGSYRFDITEQGVGTRVKLDVEYAFSSRVLDRLSRQFASQYVTRQFDSMLGNLKHYVEMDEPTNASDPSGTEDDSETA